MGPLILLGAPGAGKGTQAKVISARFRIPHISTGDLLREHINRATPLGVEVRTFVERGSLVPDQIVEGILKQRLRDNDTGRGFILDGFPRTVPQAEWFDELLRSDFLPAACRTPPVVISIVVDYNELLRRLTGRRSCPTCGRIYNIYTQPPKVAGLCDVDQSTLVVRRDDSEEVISERLKEYRSMTLPLEEYYGPRGRLIHVDGSKPREEVAAETLNAISKHANCL